MHFIESPLWITVGGKHWMLKLTMIKMKVMIIIIVSPLQQNFSIYGMADSYSQVYLFFLVYFFWSLRFCRCVSIY